MYTVLYIVHVTTVILSISFFALRGAWMIVDSPRLDHRLVRILPHVIDTLLLLSAIGLTVLVGQYPFVQGWLTAKVVGLVVYIFLGLIALKYGRSKPIRVGAFVAALLVFAYIVGVALNHNAMSWLASV